MALPLSNSFETGLADETGITTANSDDGSAGNAIDNTTFNGGSTAVYDTARAVLGTLSARFTQVAANACYIGWTAGSVGTVTELFGRFYIYTTSQPADAMWIIDASRGTRNGICRWNASGTIDVFDSTLGAAQSGSQTVPLNEWVRMEFRLLCHASTGIFEFKMFHLHETTPIETITFSSANTLADVSQIYFGQRVAFATGLTWWFDEIAASGTGYPGPAFIPEPTATFMPVQRRGI